MNNQKKIEFHFGNLGAILPFIIMLVTIIVMVVTDHKATKYYWSAAVLGILAGYIFMKDKKEFSGVVVRGVGSEMYAILCLCFMFAGIFGKALSVGGLADGILWAANKVGISGGYFATVLFIVSALLSTCMGTANGTVATVTPVFMPTAIALGCNPLLSMGAIVGGSYFGDNLAPISDTTIVSANTQETTVGECVKTRVKYSLAAGTITIVLTTILGVMTCGEATASEMMTTDAAKNLLLIIAPILLVVLIIKGMSLVAALMIGTLVAIVIGVAAGLMPFESVYSTDGGIIVGGIEGMIGIIIFSALVFCMIQMMQESGALAAFTDYIIQKCKTPMSSEIAIIVICMLTTIMVPSNTVAMVMCGAVVNRIIKGQKMAKTRGSNLLDGICVSTVGIIPYGAAMLLCHSLSAEMGVIPADLTTVDMMPYSIYCIALIVVYLFSAFSGWGRTFDEENHL